MDTRQRPQTCPGRGPGDAVGPDRYARSVPSLAAYPGMMRRARQRLGLRGCRAAWLV